MAKPSFALSVFRITAPESSGERDLIENEFTQKLYDKLSIRKNIQITRTVLNGVVCIRLAIGAERTEKRHVEEAFKLILDDAREVRGS